MQDKKLPAIIPSYKLTKQSHNIVAYCINGEKTIYCESVLVVNGWVIMNDLRIKARFYSNVKSIHKIEPSNENGFYCGDAEFHEKYFYGYEQISNRTIPEKAVTVIDSYDYTQKGRLPEWAVTDKKTAIEKANDNILKYNEEARKHNAEIFKQIVINVFEHQCHEEFKSIHPFLKWVNRLEWNKWFETKTKHPDTRDKIKKIAENIQNRYNKLKIEYTGELKLDLSDMEKFFEGNIW